MHRFQVLFSFSVFSVVVVFVVDLLVVAVAGVFFVVIRFDLVWGN